jgi:hypothetical protein
MAHDHRRNEHLVGVRRKDGTPYKLLDDGILRRMMLDWVKGKDVTYICKKYNITRIQFHHQKYHKDRFVGEFVEKVRELRDLDYSSKDMEKILKVPYEQINKIIATML